LSLLPVRLYASFAAQPGGGNIAGVVYDEVGLRDSEMQQIAADLNAPTTGFVTELGENAYQVRFFSPTEEMDMCGHVTVGVFSALSDDGRLTGASSPFGGSATQKTGAGCLAIALAARDGGQVVVKMRQNPPSYLDVSVSKHDLAAPLGVEAEMIVGDLGAVSTALRHLFVQLPDTDALRSLRPNDAGLTALCKQIGIDTIGVWALKEGGREAHVRVRDLCHGVGNGEEAASGTTNGALACWLAKLGHLRFGSDGKANVIAEQGFEMERPSVIRTTLGSHDGLIDTVEVGGSARRLLTGHFER
jgi:PhzF family phenazine biosynthesis protein